MVSSVAACCVQPSYGARPTMHCQWGRLSNFSSFFVPGDLDLWPLTLNFELERDFCTAYLIAKFDRPMFSRSKVTLRTNKQAHWQTNRLRWKHPSRFAALHRWVMIGISRSSSLDTLARPPTLSSSLRSLPAALRAAQTCRYFVYSEANFEVFRPAGATRCTDGGEIWQGGGDLRSPPPCQIAPPSVQR